MEETSPWYTLVASRPEGPDGVAARITAQESSPLFNGHFPGDPVLPGIGQIYMVTELVSVALGEREPLLGVSRVKFRKIIRPGDLLDISVVRSNKQGRYAFRITAGEDEICSGMIRFQQPGTARQDQPEHTSS